LDYTPSKFGEHLRWGTSLPDRLSELAIITTAQFWRAQYEWYTHAPLAEKAGVPAAAIDATRRGETPSFDQKEEALVYSVCTGLFKTRRLSDATFNEAVTKRGDTGLIEVIATIGYYTHIGNTLNAFQVPIPEGTAQPFPE
jgi:4-carboxymuconolactone decarboxylase